MAAPWAANYVRRSPMKAATLANRDRDCDKPDRKARADELFAALDEAGRCRTCGRTISKRQSVARRQGDVCHHKDSDKDFPNAD